MIKKVIGWCLFAVGLYVVLSIVFSTFVAVFRFAKGGSFFLPIPEPELPWVWVEPLAYLVIGVGLFWGWRKLVGKRKSE